MTRPTGVLLFAAFAADQAWQLFLRRERFSWHSLALLLIPCGLSR